MRLLVALLPAYSLTAAAFALRAPGAAAVAPRYGIDDHFAGWSVSDFDFHASYIFSTPSHQNSWGYVDFNVSSPGPEGLYCPINSSRIECSAASSQLSEFFYGTQIYRCSVPFSGSNVTFTYDWPGGKLALNQTFDCGYNRTYKAVGETEFHMNCTTDFWQNTNWTLGDLYSIRTIQCPLVQLSVPGDLIST